MAGLLTLVALTLVGGAAVATGFALRAEAARQGEKAHAEAEGQARREAQGAQREAQRQLVELSGSSGVAAASRVTTLWHCCGARGGPELARDEPDLQELNHFRVGQWFRLAWMPEGRVAVPGFRAEQDHFRTFEFSPDGNYLLNVTNASGCLVWDCRQGRLATLPDSAAKAVAAAWQPKGRFAGSRGPGRGRFILLAPPDFCPVGNLTADGEVTTLGFQF